MVADRGIDTLALLWPCQGGTEAMSAAGRVESYRHARGVLMAQRSTGGIRVLAWPEHGVLKAEGRLSAALDGDPGTWRLAQRGEVLAADDAMREAVREVLGHAPDGRAVLVGRYDLATEAHYTDPTQGLATLAAMSALAPSGHLTRTFAAPGGRVQSVAMVTERRAVPVFRAYDKGIESGSHAPGERVRFEAQRRLPSGRRTTPRQLARGDLRSAFARTLQPFVREAPMTVTHPASVVDELAGRVQRGELTVARAERLAGSIEFLRRYGRAIYETRQGQRRLRALREAGIAVSDYLPEASVVPVGQVLSDVVEAWSE